MEALMHNDYRQQPITSDEARDRYRDYLARLEAMVAEQEGAVLRARAAGDAAQVATARTSLWRLLTKRQGVVDALAAYERERRGGDGRARDGGGWPAGRRPHGGGWPAGRRPHGN